MLQFKFKLRERALRSHSDQNLRHASTALESSSLPVQELSSPYLSLFSPAEGCPPPAPTVGRLALLCRSFSFWLWHSPTASPSLTTLATWQSRHLKLYLNFPTGMTEAASSSLASNRPIRQLYSSTGARWSRAKKWLGVVKKSKPSIRLHDRHRDHDF